MRKLPSATYRLQFRDGTDFDAAIAIVPYLRDLGISHLYASPVFTATAGSTHGYDIIDHNEIDPALGGREGFDRLSAALRGAGLGLVLDIVPNHMAASLENPWWRDVVQWGRDSSCAGFFDIDWSQRLTLPVLDAPFEEVAASGDLAIVLNPDAGTLALAHLDDRFPLHSSSWEKALAPAAGPAAERLAAIARSADPMRPQSLHDSVREIADASAGLSNALAAASRDRTYLETVHELQPWELTFWKEARRRLSYRRFFEVTGLVGVRVEEPAVFDAVHALTLELVRSGQVDGLRVDHVDGLADPGAYLARLREAVGPEPYLVVEKILGEGETLSEDWPVDGTTGYEFIDALTDLLADAPGAAALSAGYEKATGAAPLAIARHRTKRLILEVNFEGEVERLVDALEEIGLPEGIGRAEVKAALTALMVAMRVYRTYSGSRADEEALARARAEAALGDPSLAIEALDWLCAILGGVEPADEERQRARILFRQLSGPAAAKGVEDTLFYRDHRLLALNEVGCDPQRPAPDLRRFHRSMRERAERSPGSLSATATHDTKRGEDARARLLTLTEDAGLWMRSVERWREMHVGRVAELDGGPAPEPETEWLIYQALLGVWPEGLSSQDGQGLAGLRQRFLGFVEKALREAKLRTRWTESDDAYEQAVADYAAGLIAPGNEAFLSDFVATTLPFRQAGRLNSLTQTLVKLTAPGVPDIYQGSEAGDFSLVDPDNRRPVDFEGLAALFSGEDEGSWRAQKLRLIAKLLGERRKQPDLFRVGSFMPLEVSGEKRSHVVAFARSREGARAIVVAPRLAMDLLDDGRIPADAWADTAVDIPAQPGGAAFRDCLSGERFEADAGTLPLRTLLQRRGMACLVNWP